mgnify:CR=1 FL=1
MNTSIWVHSLPRYWDSSNHDGWLEENDCAWLPPLEQHPMQSSIAMTIVHPFHPPNRMLHPPSIDDEGNPTRILHPSSPLIGSMEYSNWSFFTQNDSIKSTMAISGAISRTRISFFPQWRIPLEESMEEQHSSQVKWGWYLPTLLSFLSVRDEPGQKGHSDCRMLWVDKGRFEWPSWGHALEGAMHS